MCLGRAVRILRRQLFEDFPKFEGSFNKSFTASASVPAVLIHFVRMLLEGPNIESVGSSGEPAGNNAELSISQLIRYNSINKHKRKENVQSLRHSVERETPLPLYVGLMIHAVTKKKKIIDKLYRLGLSVSYNRVQEILATVTNVLCTKYKEDGVHPPKLCPNVFVTSAIDNIDHNQSSSSPPLLLSMIQVLRLFSIPAVKQLPRFTMTAFVFSSGTNKLSMVSLNNTLHFLQLVKSEVTHLWQLSIHSTLTMILPSPLEEF